MLMLVAQDAALEGSSSQIHASRQSAGSSPGRFGDDT